MHLLNRHEWCERHKCLRWKWKWFSPFPQAWRATASTLICPSYVNYPSGLLFIGKYRLSKETALMTYFHCPIAVLLPVQAPSKKFNCIFLMESAMVGKREGAWKGIWESKSRIKFSDQSERLWYENMKTYCLIKSSFHGREMMRVSKAGSRADYSGPPHRHIDGGTRLDPDSRLSGTRNGCAAPKWQSSSVKTHDDCGELNLPCGKIEPRNQRLTLMVL